MIVVQYSDFKKNLKQNLDRASNDSDVIIVSRANNKNVVVMSLDEYNSWRETNYLLSTNANRRRLDDAMKRINSEIFESHSLMEE